MADGRGRAQKSRRRIPDEELLAVLDARLAGHSLRQIAAALYGEARVNEEWCQNGWMRARVRRRVKIALALIQGGYLGMVTGA